MKHLSRKPLKHAKVVNKTYNYECMMRLLTCRSLTLVLRKDQDEQATMLSQIGCLASCGQFVHLYHLFCMQSKAIFHFYCSLHLFVSGVLIVLSV